MWYVDIIMAVAGLSRVLDWWEAERGFWNFDDEDEDEPIIFVMKPGREESGLSQEFARAMSVSDRTTSPLSTTLAVPEAPSSVTSYDTQSVGSTAPPTAKLGTGGTPKAQAVEDLKFLAEHQKSVNIVMELGLQGEEIQYVNDAVMEVLGYVLTPNL